MLRGAWLLDVLVAMRTDPDYWDVLQVKPGHLDSMNAGRFDPVQGKYDTTAGERGNTGLPRIKEIRVPGEGDYPGEYLILTPRWQENAQQALEKNGLMHEFRVFERSDNPSEVAYIMNGKATWGWHPDEVKSAALLLSRLTPVERLSA